MGKSLALGRLYAIHDIHRCPRGQAFLASGRLVKSAQASAGKRDGTSGKKIGHASRKWAFSEAAGRFWRNKPAGQQSLARIERTHGQGKAFTLLAHKFARAVYDRRKRDTAFD